MAEIWKEVIPSIMKNKRNVLITEVDEKEYPPFVVNAALAYHKDCVYHANRMNINNHLDHKLQYHYLLHTIRGYKRDYIKWYKREAEADIALVQEYYSYSREKAKAALPLLSEEQLQIIKEKLDKGGKITNS